MRLMDRAGIVVLAALALLVASSSPVVAQSTSKWDGHYSATVTRNVSTCDSWAIMDTWTVAEGQVSSTFGKAPVDEFGGAHLETRNSRGTVNQAIDFVFKGSGEGKTFSATWRATQRSDGSGALCSGRLAGRCVAACTSGVPDVLDPTGPGPFFLLMGVAAAVVFVVRGAMRRPKPLPVAAPPPPRPTVAAASAPAVAPPPPPAPRPSAKAVTPPADPELAKAQRLLDDAKKAKRRYELEQLRDWNLGQAATEERWAAIYSIPSWVKKGADIGVSLLKQYTGPAGKGVDFAYTFWSKYGEELAGGASAQDAWSAAAHETLAKQAIGAVFDKMGMFEMGHVDLGQVSLGGVKQILTGGPGALLEHPAVLPSLHNTALDTLIDSADLTKPASALITWIFG